MPTRRGVLSSLAAGAAALLGGCTVQIGNQDNMIGGGPPQNETSDKSGIVVDSAEFAHDGETDPLSLETGDKLSVSSTITNYADSTRTRTLSLTVGILNRVEVDSRELSLDPGPLTAGDKTLATVGDNTTTAGSLVISQPDSGDSGDSGDGGDSGDSGDSGPFESLSASVSGDAQDSVESLSVSWSSVDGFDENGTEIDTISLSVSGGSFDPASSSDCSVELERELSSGPSRDTISVNDDDYSGSEATLDLSGYSETSCVGSGSVSVDKFRTPGESGSVDLEIVLDGDQTVQASTTVDL